MTAGLAHANCTHRLYKITAPDGRAYIGCTNGPLETRWRGHVSAAFGAGAHIFKPDSLQAAIVIFGADAFRLEQLETARSRVEGFERERDLIIQRTPHGFNRRVGRSSRERDIIDVRPPRRARAA